MNMRKIDIATLGVALVCGLGSTAAARAANAQATPAQAAPGQATQHRAHKMGPGRRGEMGARRDSALFRGITLSDAQKTQIKAIRDKYRTQWASLRDQGRAGGQGDVRRQRPDSATRAQMRSLMEQQQGEVRGVLTADQQKVYDKNLASVRSRAQEHRKNGQGHAQGAPKKSGTR
jgi:Spy/CpxP family protein refolding chaperone